MNLLRLALLLNALPALAVPGHLRDVLGEAYSSAEVAALVYHASLRHPEVGTPSEIFKPDYLELFDGKHGWRQATARFPEEPEAIFRPEYLEAVKLDPDHPLLRALREDEEPSDEPAPGKERPSRENSAHTEKVAAQVTIAQIGRQDADDAIFPSFSGPGKWAANIDRRRWVARSCKKAYAGIERRKQQR